MALKTLIPFPITTTTTTTTSTEIRLSRWNNANADKYEERRLTQHQLEHHLRLTRRFDSAFNITTLTQQEQEFKSTGTPSTPSLPSIPPKLSKYKHPQHPAFRNPHHRPRYTNMDMDMDIRVGDNGLTYVLPGAPFEFMYSYTETPKNVKPLSLREPPLTPFGPATMPRPWTGRKPLSPTNKKLPDFDSFHVPQSGKKGVKTVQNPGPYLPGTGPKYVKSNSRDDLLGEPLTFEEVNHLVQACRNTKRQLNMGRDGLTHNMLDNIHAHWKRRRVCKIRCKGVCTVDMDNVSQQLEEKTGGKIIYRRGGIVYLFRGRNYNYKTRPRFPLMLWKPVTPVYPRLINRVPEGLTLEEATDMRKRGRQLIPICKLGKNGVYVKLAKNVREAFEECELVRINCQGLNPSDYRKIGAKLKDLVPCVLISFENEHILMWRGKDWKPSILSPEDGIKGDKSFETDGASSADNLLDSEDEDEEEEEDDDDDDELPSSNVSNQGLSDEPPNARFDHVEVIKAVSRTKAEDGSFVKDGTFVHSSDSEDADDSDNAEVSLADSCIVATVNGDLQSSSETSSPCTEDVIELLKQAVESGKAVILDDTIPLDADKVYERSVDFAKVAPPGPVYRHNPRKVAVKKPVNKKTVDIEADELKIEAVSVTGRVEKLNEKISKEQKRSRIHKGKDFEHEFVDVVPQGSLKIDELAKLLA